MITNASKELSPCYAQFWFQNRRTQVKSQSERNENQVLRAEKDRLIKENLYLRESLRVAQVHALQAVKGGTDAERQLQLENKRLKAEVRRKGVFVWRGDGRFALGDRKSQEPLVNKRLKAEVRGGIEGTRGTSVGGD